MKIKLLEILIKTLNKILNKSNLLIKKNNVKKIRKKDKLHY